MSGLPRAGSPTGSTLSTLPLAPLAVAVDGRSLQSVPVGGVGRAVRTTLAGLAGAPAAHGLGAIHLLVDDRGPAVPDLPPGITVHRLRAPVPGGAIWLQAAVPRWLSRHRVDVFHCPFYGLPYRQPVPMVVSIYDVSFRHFPEWFTRRRRAAFLLQAAQAARGAAVVLTGSAHVASEVVRHLGVAPDRVAIAPPAPDRAFLDAGAGSAPGRARLQPGPPWRAPGPGPVGDAPPEAGKETSPPRPYVVALGGAARRRLPVAVGAWSDARDLGLDIDLVVVGTEAPATAGAVPGLRWAGPLGDTDMAGLLAGAAAFVYPTAYEGFGLPALEAAAAGTPVVSAPVGALPEVLGDAAAWVTRPARRPLAEALVELLGDAGRQRRLSEAGRARARCWAARAGGPEGAAAVTAAAYRRAGGGARAAGGPEAG